MDYINYLEKKALGVVTMSKVGDDYVVTYKQFDSNTGIELAPIVKPFKRNELVKARKALGDERDLIDLVLADVDALG